MDAGAFPRRFLTVLSADVDAFTRMMSRDEEHCLREWRQHVERAEALAERHAGRLFGVAGDSFMVEFASAAQGVEFARSLQEQVARHNHPLAPERRMNFRLGLHIGSVMVEAERLYGDAVNIAARLQELAPPGGVVVSEAVHEHAAPLVEAQWSELGVRQLRNIPYPVVAYLMRSDAAGAPAAATSRPPDASVGGTAARVSPTSLSTLVDAALPGLGGRPALAVLPFEIHHSSSNRLQYLEDALPEELIRRLSRLRSFPVLDKASSFAFRNVSADSARIGAALDARYLVYGAVTWDGRRASLTVSLVDAEHRQTLWKERYDGRDDRPAEIEDDVVLRIVASLGTEVNRVEQVRSRRRPLASLDVDELVQRAAWHQNKLSRSHAFEARRLLGLALAREPDHAEALIQLSWWYFWKIWTERGDKAELAEMRRLASRAMQLDPTDGRTHMLHGIAELMTGNPRHAITILSEAVALDPSLSVAHSCIGSAYVLSGEPARGLEPLATALRLNPHSVYLFHQLGELAAAHLLLGRWSEARAWAQRSLRLRPGYWYARVIDVTAACRAGDTAAADAGLAALLTHCPHFAIAHLYWLPFADRRWADDMAAALRETGFRDPDPGRATDAISPRLQ